MNQNSDLKMIALPELPGIDRKPLNLVNPSFGLLMPYVEKRSKKRISRAITQYPELLDQVYCKVIAMEKCSLLHAGIFTQYAETLLIPIFELSNQKWICADILESVKRVWYEDRHMNRNVHFEKVNMNVYRGVILAIPERFKDLEIFVTVYDRAQKMGFEKIFQEYPH